MDVAIRNECGRLIANVVIAYNSILLLMLLNRYQVAGEERLLELLKKISGGVAAPSLPGALPISGQPPANRFRVILAHAGFD